MSTSEARGDGGRLRREPLELDRLLEETADPASGGLVVFAGTVRNENEGRSVERLSYEAHAALAERTLAQLEEEVLDRFEVRRCRVAHRTGTLEVGEPSVLVVVRAAHRAEAFEAARWAIDELKERVPLWKEEHYADGESRYLDGTPLRTDATDGEAAAGASKPTEASADPAEATEADP